MLKFPDQFVRIGKSTNIIREKYEFMITEEYVKAIYLKAIFVQYYSTGFISISGWLNTYRAIRIG